MSLNENQKNVNSFQSKQTHWEKYASIRSRPRRILPEESDGEYLFPIARQPLCIHPKVQERGEQVRKYILVQSLYKYMNDIANIETDVINRSAIKIAKDQFHFKFSDDIKQDALSIVIDESYHAYVALDFMRQVTARTGIIPLELPKDTELSNAIRMIRELLPSSLQDDFELIAVCIAEHVLTNDLIGIAKAEDVSKTFYSVMNDHVIDEGRHSSIFASVLGQFWNSMSSEHQDEIGAHLAILLERYLQSELQMSFERNMLKSLHFSNSDVDAIIHETYSAVTDKSVREASPIVRQVLSLLRKSGVLENKKTHSAFQSHSFLD